MLRKVLLIAHNHKQSLCSGQGNVKSVRGLCESQRILFGEAVLSESRKIGRIVFVGLNNMASHHRDNDYIALHTLESVNGTNSDGNILVEFCQSPYLLYLFPVETDDSICLSSSLLNLSRYLENVEEDANLSSSFPITSTSP